MLRKLGFFSIDPDTVIRETLPNGLRVLVRRDPSAPVVAIVTYVSAGYFDETDDVVGIAHVLEHMYFKGTPTRGVGEIARQTKEVGGYLNAATIYDHTSYYTVLSSSGFLHGLEVQFDAYANSLIDEGELARELEVIIEEAKRKADNPAAIATETLYEMLHDRHRMRRWRIGREEELRRLTRESLWRFYRNFYHPGNTILSIVGDVDPAVALKRVTQLYGQLPKGEPERIPGPREDGSAEFRYREWSGDIGQSQLAFGWRTPETMHPDTPILDVVATALGAGRASRLYRAVRERKLASSISAYDYTPTELGVFVVHAETPPASTRDAARAVWAQLCAVRDDDLGDQELERAKRVYESRWVRRLEDMEGQANFLAEWESLGDWRLGDHYLERVMTATRPQITDVAVRHLDPDRASVLVYRPNGSPRVAESATDMRESLDRFPEPLPAIAPYAPAEPPPARPVRAEHEQGGVCVYRTPHGVPILVRKKPGAGLLHVGAYVAGGAVDEPEEAAGLTTLMVRSALKGTTSRDALQIAEEAEMLGGSVSGATGADSFGWSISVPVRHARAAVELLADVVQHPVFPESAVETERAVAIADVIALRDDMFRYPLRLATQAAFAGDPYGVPATGTEESLRRITVDQLRDWHERRVRHAPLVIGMVGDSRPDEMAAIVARAFSDVRHAEALVLPPPVWPAEARADIAPRDKAQTALAVLFPAPDRKDDDRFAAELISTVASGLGGRLFEELRDKRSLCYTVQAFASERRRTGMFVTYIAMSPEKEEPAREGLLRELQRFREEPVLAGEIARAQTYAIGIHAIRRQSGGFLLSDMIDAWLLGSLDELSTYEQRIEAVTPEQMQIVAHKYFDVTRRVEGVVRGVSRAV